MFRKLTALSLAFSKSTRPAISFLGASVMVTSWLSWSANASLRAPSYPDTSDPAIVQSLLQVNSWLYLALFIMCFTTIFAVGISFYLYRWRRIILSDGRVLMPEELGSSIRGFDHRIEDLTNGLQSFAGTMNEMGQNTREDAKSLLQTFMTLQSALDERDQEIQRLKRGYDASLFRRFLNRFIRVDQAAEDFSNSGEIDQNAITQIRDLLADAFAECGVERYEPELMSDYRNAEGIADNPKKKPTDDPNLIYKISDVVEPGYKISGQEGDTILIPAKVRIFILDDSIKET